MNMMTQKIATAFELTIEQAWEVQEILMESGIHFGNSSAKALQTAIREAHKEWLANAQ